MGLDDPFFVRYFRYLKNIAHGDFGTSYRSSRPVIEEIMIRFPSTFKLSLYSISLVIIFGLFLGVLSAVKKYSWIDIVSTVVAMLAASVPTFWLGLLLILFFSLKLHWLPSNGISLPFSYLMPSIALSLPVMADVSRITRSSMLEIITKDYIRTARAKGLAELAVISRHALRNALLPIVTVIGQEFGQMLGGAILVETVFSMPGLGSLVVDSIRSKDVPQIMAATLFLALMFCIVLLIVDISYVFLDPRLKSHYESGRK
jgi:peptide/nickel transport system permease protein